MDSDDRTIGRIYTRREALLRTAQAGIGLTIAQWLGRYGPMAAAAPTTQPRPPLVASPAMTEGPFFNDEKLNRSDLLGGTTREAVVKGAPLLLTIAVYRLEGETFEPMKDVQVDLWHCDAVGVYSGESHPMNPENTAGETWLRGYQVSDEHGLVKFQTIVPGWYPGRTPHLHFKVRPRPADGQPQREFTSQLYFNDHEINVVYGKGIYAGRGRPNTRNATDGIYNARLADGTPAGDQMLLDLVENDEGKGYYTELPILLTDDSLRSGRGRGGWGGASNGPGGRGPRPGRR